jgi:hypothetical protein
VIYGVLESPIKGESIAEKIFSDWLLSGIYVAGSGRPFNLLLGFDANGDGRSQSDRPGQAARNSARGEPFHQVDMRLGRRFNVGGERRYLEFTFEAFNLLNKTNYTGINNVVGCGPISTLGGYCATPGAPAIENFNARGIKGRAPTQPLGFTSSAPARQLQFGARFNF